MWSKGKNRNEQQQTKPRKKKFTEQREGRKRQNDVRNINYKMSKCEEQTEVKLSL